MHDDLDPSERSHFVRCDLEWGDSDVGGILGAVEMVRWATDEECADVRGRGVCGGIEHNFERLALGQRSVDGVFRLGYVWSDNAAIVIGR